MHKAVLSLLLAMVSSSAIAEWELLGTDGNGTATVYADSSAIYKRDGVVKIWTMIDFKKPANLSDGKQFLSWKTQYEFDCKRKRSRTLAATMHSENMGGGELTNHLDFESPAWAGVPPDSNGEVLWIYACRKRYQREQDARKHCPDDTVVWLNLSSGVIHYKGQHWYGRTHSGVYACKNEVAR